MRRFSFLMLAACLTISVVGCSGDSAPSPEGPAVVPASGADSGSSTAPADGSEKKEDSSAAKEAPAE